MTSNSTLPRWRLVWEIWISGTEQERDLSFMETPIRCICAYPHRIACICRSAVRYSGGGHSEVCSQEKDSYTTLPLDDLKFKVKRGEVTSQRMANSMSS